MGVVSYPADQLPTMGWPTQGRILECHPCPLHDSHRRRAITISASPHRERCSYVIHPTVVAIQQGASPMLTRHLEYICPVPGIRHHNAFN